MERNIIRAKLASGLVRQLKLWCRTEFQLGSLVKRIEASVLSRLDYGLHISWPISMTHCGKMDRILRQALRTISASTAETLCEASQLNSSFHNMEQVHVNNIAIEYVKI